MIAGARRSFGVGALWSVAAVAAVAGHAAVAAMALAWTPEGDTPPAAPPVLMINLEPIVAPQVPEQQVAPGPQAVDSMPQEEQKLPEKVVEAVPDVPKLPEVEEQAVAILSPPMPEPKPEMKPEPQEKPVETKKERKKTERKVASRAAAPTTFEAPRAAQAHAQAAGAARVPVAALASWKSALAAQLNRYKRYPAGSAGSGTAMVAFSIGRSGEVTSARLARSSGDRALDQEAVALPRRASPLPKPPDGLVTGTIPITVPIYFGRRD
jgi:protein TonB